MPMTSAYHPSNPRTRKLTDEQRREAVRLYSEGWTYNRIAREFGVSDSAIVYHVTRRAVLRTQGPTGRKGQGHKRLTKEQRADVRARLAAGQSARSIADIHGVSHAAVLYHARKAAVAVGAPAKEIA